MYVIHRPKDAMSIKSESIIYWLYIMVHLPQVCNIEKVMLDGKKVNELYHPFSSSNLKLEVLQLSKLQSVK